MLNVWKQKKKSVGYPKALWPPNNSLGHHSNGWMWSMVSMPFLFWEWLCGPAVPTQLPEVQHANYVFPTAQGLVYPGSSSIANHFSIAPGQAMTSKPFQRSRIFNQCNIIKMFYWMVTLCKYMGPHSLQTYQLKWQLLVTIFGNKIPVLLHIPPSAFSYHIVQLWIGIKYVMIFSKMLKSLDYNLGIEEVTPNIEDKNASCY
jgi:hypothetical protein